MPSTRRTFVAAAAVWLAGCSSGGPSNGSPTSDTPSSSPTSRSTESAGTTDIGETADVGDLDVRAHDAEASHSYFELPYPDFASVATSDGSQFVSVTVDVRGGSDLDVPESGAFSIAVGERTYSAQTGRSTPSMDPGGAPYSRERREGWMRFEIPAPIGDGVVRFQLDGEGGPVEWQFGPELVGKLREPAPEFEVRDFEAPEEVGPDEPIELSATVENVGDGPGTFRAALNQEGDIMYGGSTTTFEMEAGEERDWRETVDTHVDMDPDEAATIRLRFRSSGGDVDHDVAIEPGRTTED